MNNNYPFFHSSTCVTITCVILMILLYYQENLLSNVFYTFFLNLSSVGYLDTLYYIIGIFLNSFVIFHFFIEYIFNEKSFFRRMYLIQPQNTAGSPLFMSVNSPSKTPLNLVISTLFSVFFSFQKVQKRGVKLPFFNKKSTRKCFIFSYNLLNF